ncbi:S9 family peptidase [Prevotella sp. OH937_COT-195]|uniref:S9 family peptidase n=1 Tax=Prevotella sp. OH937_COT-195 TaxID=2491051 RepID=UPI000F6494AF|nr:S9 family peptidase [Prevotella sp. OH937_COT-195]RRC99113.1 S9 family peptidase [Prevotella sp. OH937_COT-195]
MKKLVILFAAALFFSISTNAQSKLELRDITSNKFSPQYLSAITPMPDGESYAQISDDMKQIIQYSFKNGKKISVLFDINNTDNLSIKKFDGYLLSPDGKKILIQTNTKRIYRHSFTADYYIYNILNKRLEKLSENGSQQSPIWSKDGTQVAFVRNNNIFLVKLIYDNSESQVTKDGKFNEVINGIPDWVNEEEFGFSTAMTFNADGTVLSWIRYDESKVKTYSLQMFKGTFPEHKENGTYPGNYSYKYPKAGETNSSVSVLSYDIKSHKTRTLDIPLPNEGYIPRIKSTNNASRIIVYTMNRHQDELSLYAVNPYSTVSRLIVKEKVEKYVKEDAMNNILITDNHIVIPSDRSGYMQLYLYTQNGNFERQLTSGNHDVTKLYGYDDDSGTVYYQSAGNDAMNREIYSSDKKGRINKLACDRGWNDAVFSSNFKYFVNTWSDCNTPYRFTICTNAGKVISTLIDNSKLRSLLKEMPLGKKEFFTFKTSENVELNGIMIKPSNFDPSRKYPVIMWQYSGPGSQQVVNSWRIGSMGQGALYDHYLAECGFILVCVDGRGTGAKGAEFEKCTYLRLGLFESKDQAETAIYLKSLPYVDENNIGIWGWSFGGFNTLMSMSEGRGVFASGVAVAPPTDWRFYDTVYTERYMRTPKENPSGYDINPMNRVDNMSGKLLICQGLADDNVHPQNTYEYTESLVQADKDFKMNVYTNRNHSIYGGNTRNHLLRQIANHFIETLK